jgi:hypothetical protein
MKILSKYLLIIFIGLVLVGTFFILKTESISARELEIHYPTLPGGQVAPTTDADHAAYLSYLFYFAIESVGIIAFVILVYGGVSYLVSAGSVTKMKSARTKIYGGLFGIMIVLGSYLVVRTINPNLVGITDEPLIPSHGICLYSQPDVDTGKQDLFCIQESTPEIILPVGFEIDFVEIESPKEELSAIFLFPEYNYAGGSFQTIRNNFVDENGKTRQDFSYNPKSIYFDEVISGLVLFPTENCRMDFDDYPDNLPLPIGIGSSDLGLFNDRTESLRFRFTYDNAEDWLSNHTVGTLDYYSPDIYWGGVFHTKTGGEGQCGIVYEGTTIDTHNIPISEGVIANYTVIPKCTATNSLDIEPSRIRSVDVFARQFSEELRGGVTFCQNLDFATDVDGTGCHTISAAEIQNGHEYFWEEEISYPWNGLERIYSVKVDGSYWVVLNNDLLYNDDENAGADCQVFKDSTTDLKSSSILRGTVAFRPKVKRISIIPVVEQAPSIEL